MNVHTATRTDSMPMVWAASYLMSISMLVTNLQPVVLGALADTLGFSNRELGYISAALMGASTLCIATAPFWVRRANWRHLSYVCLVLGTASAIAGMVATTFALFLLLFVVMGVVKGALNAPSFACLGDTRNPDRNFGISAVVQAITASIIVWPVSAYVIPHYGTPGVFVVIALVVASGLPLVRLIPTHGTGNVEVDHTRLSRESAPIVSRAAVPAFAMLVATALFSAGLVGFWYFVERIGVELGVTPAVIGLTLSLGSLASILAASIVAWLSVRIPSLLFAAVGTGCLLACFAILYLPGAYSFVIANILFSLGWGLTQPPYWAMLRKVDRTDRLFVAAPVAGGLASVLIGVMAGPIIESYGFGGMIGFCAIASLLALATAAIIIWTTRTQPGELQPA